MEDENLVSQKGCGPLWQEDDEVLEHTPKHQVGNCSVAKQDCAVELDKTPKDTLVQDASVQACHVMTPMMAVQCFHSAASEPCQYSAMSCQQVQKYNLPWRKKNKDRANFQHIVPGIRNSYSSVEMEWQR